MRLVSALYDDHYPFFAWDIFKTMAHTIDPGALEGNDMLVVWGGGDISPSLYNKPISMFGGGSKEPSHRDQVEWNLMKRAVELQIPIIGVCRGAQMLCALAGGHLIQHVQGHAGPNHMVTTDDGKSFEVNSIHHQMMVPPEHEDYELVAVASDKRSEVYWDVIDNKDENVDMDVEPEFIYFPRQRGFAIQWHPEGMQRHCAATQYLKDYITHKIVC